MSKNPLDSLRAQINRIDEQLQRLINERGEIGKQIAELKRSGGGDEPSMYVPEREEAVLAAVRGRNADAAIPDDDMLRIFREVISATRAVEKIIKVAILGPQGTYTEEAMYKHFGHSIEPVFQPSIDDVFTAVENERADFGVVPVENSSEGVVASTLDCIIESSLSICGEIELTIRHALLSNVSERSAIKTVYGHPQALAQCRKWIGKNLPHASIEAAKSSSDAVQQAKGSDSAAAIAGELAAELYEIDLHAANIQDLSGNTTRFLVVGNISVGATGTDKTSLLLSQEHRPGALFELLKPFNDLKVDMTKIESRPSRGGLWQYVFFIDFIGHVEDEKIVKLLEQIKSKASLFRILGSYPRSAR